MNLYSYAGNNPISFDDPYGLCVPVNVCLAVAGALIGGGTRIAYNLDQGNDWTEGVGSDMAKGAAIGLTFGLAAPAIVSAEVGTAATVGASTVPTATNPALQNTISALFRAGDKIAGGTAGAIRNEAMTGKATGGLFHLQKGIERIANLERILRRESLSAADRQTAQRLLGDLQDAVTFAQEQAAKQ